MNENLSTEKQVDETGRLAAQRTGSVLKSQTVKEPNREHGEDDPRGADAVTAPATVSGEVLCGLRHWATGKASQNQRPAKSGDLPRERTGTFVSHT